MRGWKAAFIARVSLDERATRAESKLTWWFVLRVPVLGVLELALLPTKAPVEVAKSLYPSTDP